MHDEINKRSNTWAYASESSCLESRKPVFGNWRNLGMRSYSYTSSNSFVCAAAVSVFACAAVSEQYSGSIRVTSHSLVSPVSEHWFPAFKAAQFALAQVLLRLFILSCMISFILLNNGLLY